MEGGCSTMPISVAKQTLTGRIGRISVAVLLTVILGTFLTACNKVENDSPLVSAEPIAVKFAIEPNRLLAGNVATFRVTVTQGSEPVSDANDVKFELWHEGDAQHEFIRASHAGKGVYLARKRLDRPGKYHVIYHVTARDMHSMDEVLFTVESTSVGSGKGEKEGQLSAVPEAQTHSRVTIDLKVQKTLIAQQEEMFTVTLTQLP
nr:hypothetical protein [Bacillota bacterium]